jgi:tetratricopeptide (TPR) repeat protein
MASGDVASLRAAAESDPTGRLRTLDLIATCLHDAGDHEAALALSRRLRAAHPSDFWVHYRGGIHAAKVPGGDREALECMTAAVALRPGSAWARAALGLYLARVSDVDGALEACREATRLNPTLVHVHLDTAEALAKTNLAAATEVCEEAIRQRPDHAPAHNALAQVLLCRGENDAAIAACREAIRLDPRFGPPHSNLGMALVAQGRIDDAIAAFREAIRLEPDLDEPHNNLAVSLLREKHDPAGAIAVCREAIRLKHDRPNVHGTLGLALSEEGDHAGAIAACREAARLRPKEPRRLMILGFVLDRAGDLDEAIDATREAVRVDPEYADAYVPLGVRLGRIGDLEGAADAFRAAIRLQPRLAIAHAGLGFTLANLGDLEGAVAASERAVELAPGLAAPHYSLGYALGSKEEHDRAITALREAIRLEPNHVSARLYLGQALLSAGRFEEALDSRRTLHEIGSNMPGWDHPSAAWVVEAERLVAMEKRLPEYLSGAAKPRDVAEAMDLATVCRCKGLYPEAARFLEDALARDPALATIQAGDLLFEAACTLSRAAAHPGEDSPRWRRAALGCLRTRLAAYDGSPPLTVASSMLVWRRSRDLASVRDRIDELPEPEREAWRKLWADVDTLLARAREQLR